MRGRFDDPNALFTSSTDKYAGLATINNIGGFIIVIKMVIGFADGGEEIYSDPFVLVTGPPVVPLQPSSGVESFERADLGLTESTMSPSHTVWHRDRLYSLVFPLHRESRSWSVEGLKQELERSSDSILCARAHEPFKLFSPMHVSTHHQEVGNNAEDEFPFFIPSGGPNAVDCLSKHDRTAFAVATSVSPEQLEASGNRAYTGVFAQMRAIALPKDHGLLVGMVVEPCTLDTFLEVVGYYDGTVSDYDWLDHPWARSWFLASKLNPSVFAQHMFTWAMAEDSLAPCRGLSPSEEQELFFGYVWLKLAYMCFRDALFNGPPMAKLILPHFHKYEEAAAHVLGSAIGIQFLPPDHQVLLYLLTTPLGTTWLPNSRSSTDLKFAKRLSRNPSRKGASASRIYVLFPRLAPLFTVAFFEKSPALLKGLRSTSFESGAYLGTSSTELSEGLSFWHLVASLFEVEDGCIPSRGLSADALCQLIIYIW
jgi:hypothetical protein